MEVRCDHCKKWVEKSIGHANRAKKLGARQFCNRACFGLFWRHNKTTAEKKAEKAAYDQEYRKLNFEKIRLAHVEYFKKDYAANPEKYRKERQRRMKAHVEYCRQPEYKKKKKSYDERYRAYIMYGEFAEAAIILKKIEAIVDRRQARFDKNCHNKSQKRKRLWKSSQQSVLKKPSGKLSQASKQGKCSTRTRTPSPRKPGKSSGQPTLKLKSPRPLTAASRKK